MSRDATWVVDPCTKFELETTYRSRVIGQLQFSIDRQLKDPIFTFGGVKGVKFNLSNPQKAETTYNDVLSVGMCPKMRPVGVAKKRKKDRNFHASN